MTSTGADPSSYTRLIYYNLWSDDHTFDNMGQRQGTSPGDMASSEYLTGNYSAGALDDLIASPTTDYLIESFDDQGFGALNALYQAPGLNLVEGKENPPAPTSAAQDHLGGVGVQEKSRETMDRTLPGHDSFMAQTDSSGMGNNHGSAGDGFHQASSEYLAGNSAGASDDPNAYLTLEDVSELPGAQEVRALNSHDQALGLNPPGGEESPPAPTSAAEVDLRGANRRVSTRLLLGEGLGGGVQEESRETVHGTHGQDNFVAQTAPSGMGDNHGSAGDGFRQDGRECLGDSNSDHLEGVGKEKLRPVRLRQSINEKARARKKRCQWIHVQKNAVFRLVTEATQSSLRGSAVWEFVSRELWARFKIQRTAEACNNLWDTSKKHLDAIRKFGPIKYWKMEAGERSTNKLPREFEKEWYDTMNLYYQKKKGKIVRGAIRSRRHCQKEERVKAMEKAMEKGSLNHSPGDGVEVAAAPDYSKRLSRGIVGVGDGAGDEDRLDKESQPAIEASDVVELEVGAAFKMIEKLCTTKEQVLCLTKIFKGVKHEVEAVVSPVKPALESELLVGKDRLGKSYHDYRFRTLISETIVAAIERSGIIPILLDNKRKEEELELQSIRELNRALEKQMK